MNILITGGAGYIGSHTCVELMVAGHKVVVFDNLSNSHPEALRRIERITGQQVVMVKGDVRNRNLLEQTLREHRCDAVIHFAGLKAVGESVGKPLAYYDNNVVGSLSLLEAMQAAKVNTIVFSSSATVYGDPEQLPIPETHRLSASNPYGRSKIMVEDILRDFHHAQPDWRIALLRYFNPVGAHESGLIGEDPQGHPNNLMPYVARVAVGGLPYLNIWGDDYPTPDGTGVRDYIHVTDLAIGHVRALERLGAPQCMEVNLGTGRGYSVLEVVKAFEAASGRAVPYRIAPRRPGDIAACYADPSLAEKLLGWRAERTLEMICDNAWRWQQRNPNGFRS
ncbi:MAG: UDP-glucose 4-epimerase GalE [Sulfuriferula multivorans]|uniref:UDP-glucose 4-epimerase n=1 Tax=Sulfuriferula multivorans TaxID=1559896 RepID=A0A7C9NTE4_9PROT|nr:UDP-glucose 4-epimerase GalE [Sulfuriferula multivorans]